MTIGYDADVPKTSSYSADRTRHVRAVTLAAAREVQQYRQREIERLAVEVAEGAST